jgi:hypothetical protein
VNGRKNKMLANHVNSKWKRKVEGIYLKDVHFVSVLQLKLHNQRSSESNGFVCSLDGE